jgi:hypothetical protein
MSHNGFRHPIFNDHQGSASSDMPSHPLACVASYQPTLRGAFLAVSVFRADKLFAVDHRVLGNPLCERVFLIPSDIKPRYHKGLEEYPRRLVLACRSARLAVTFHGARGYNDADLQTSAD